MLASTVEVRSNVSDYGMSVECVVSIICKVRYTRCVLVYLWHSLQLKRPSLAPNQRLAEASYVSSSARPLLPTCPPVSYIASSILLHLPNFVRTAFHSCEESLRPRSCRGIYIHSDNRTRLSLLHTKPNRREGRTPSLLGATSRVHRRSPDATNILAIATFWRLSPI